MVKERLSQLQRWILKRCLEEGLLWRSDVREFFGKKFNPKRIEYPWRDEDRKYYNWDTREYPNGHKQELFSPKKELLSTRSIEATISRSLRNLKEKELIVQLRKRGEYQLTEKGFLKVNKREQDIIVNFKQYQEKVSELLKGREEALGNLIQNIKEAQKGARKQNQENVKGRY